MVELQSNTVIKNAVGDKIYSWEPYATVWAGYRQFKGVRTDEYYLDDKRYNTTYIHIVMYYRDDVSVSDRVYDLKDGRAYEVIHINNTRGEDSESILTCREIN